MKKKNLPKVGRPEIILSDEQWKYINQFLMAQCNGTDVAEHFGMSPDSFYDKVVERYGISHNISNFSEYQRIKRSEGKEMLRHKQFEKAMIGDNTMLIWLGKQVLGQRDQIEQTITVPQVQVHTLNESERLEIATALTALEEHESNDDIPAESDGDSKE